MVGVFVEVLVDTGVKVGVLVRVPVPVGVLVRVLVRVGLGVKVKVGVLVKVGVDVRVLVAVGGVPVKVGVAVPPASTSRKAAETMPQVWKPEKLFTPRPRTKMTWRPGVSEVVSMVADTATVCEPPKVPDIAMGTPPAQGGVST